jgi:hypothetical protein
MAFTTFSISSRLTPLKKYVHSSNGMLVFNDELAFTTVVDCLYACIQSLENVNLNIDIDEYDYVLEQFENVMGHKSLRQYVARKVNGLLAIDELTDENDPDECFFPDPVLRSLVNTDFELRIASKIVSLRNVQNEYLKMKRDPNYEPEYQFPNETSNKREQQSESSLSDNCKVSGSSNGITITEFRLRPILGFSNEIIIKAKLDGDCAKIKNDFFRVNIEISGPNGFSDSFSGYTLYPYFDGTISFSQTENFLSGEGKYKICAWIDKEGSSCKSAKVCCEFSVKFVKEECCKLYALNNKPAVLYNNGKSKMTSYVFLMNTIILPYSSISARTKNYNWVRNKFRPRKAVLTVQVFGHYHRYSCTDRIVPFDTGIKEKKNKTREVTVVHYDMASMIFVKKERVESIHNVKWGLAYDTKKIAKC